MSATAETPGLFGKLPSHGDFLTRRLSRNFLDAWDGWLQQAVATSKAELGDAWLNTYLTSPIWCFVIPRGVCGQRGWAGVMMPSVDRVGRYFPLTLAAPIPDDCNPLEVVGGAAGWFRRASELALSGLTDPNFGLDQLDAAVQNLGPITISSSTSVAADSLSQSAAPGLRLPLQPNESPLSALQSFAHPILAQRFPAYSVWWTEGSPQFAGSMLICDRLPAPAAHAGMLNGQWRSDLWLVVPDSPSAGATLADPLPADGPVIPNPMGGAPAPAAETTDFLGSADDGSEATDFLGASGDSDTTDFLGPPPSEPPADMGDGEGMSFEEFARKHSAQSEGADDLLIEDAVGGDVTSLGTAPGDDEDELPDPFADEPPLVADDSTQPRDGGGFAAGSEEDTIEAAAPVIKDEPGHQPESDEPGDTVRVPAITGWTDPLGGGTFGQEAEVADEPAEAEPAANGEVDAEPEAEPPKDVTVPRYREAARVQPRRKPDEGDT